MPSHAYVALVLVVWFFAVVGGITVAGWLVNWIAWFAGYRGSRSTQDRCSRCGHNPRPAST
jgi:hypothetical protein